MMQKRLLALASLAFLDSVAATAAHGHPRTAPDETTPSAFDGKWITNPPPGPGNEAVEWWWFHALGPEVNGVIPSFDANFYEGFAFTRAPTDPNYRFDVTGVFPNGTAFVVSTPITVAPSIITSGQAVVGNWGNGLGTFALSGDRRSLVLNFNNSASGLTGTVTFINQGTPAHGPCSKSTSAPPYFAPLAAGKTLNAAETVLYEQTGWAITMPRAAAVVDIHYQGSHLFIPDAIGYHDHNWAPQGLDKFAYTWLFGAGSCGPFDVSYLEVQALGSNHTRDIVQGLLAYNGNILQDQCSNWGSRTTDALNITLTGQTTDPVTGQQIPTGVTIQYTLANGTEYVFNLQNNVLFPAQIPYHRWRLGGSGGRVGGPQYSCRLIADWLNPGLAPYQEGKNIFETQASS